MIPLHAPVCYLSHFFLEQEPENHLHLRAGELHQREDPVFWMPYTFLEAVEDWIMESDNLETKNQYVLETVMDFF